jgi:hypothetical protein
METPNFSLAFGKHKGKMFLDTPKSYQEWLLSQEWFKVPTPSQAKYDVIRKFVLEYRIGMGRVYEIVMHGLSWDEAEQYKNEMNLAHLDDITEYFYTDYSRK